MNSQLLLTVKEAACRMRLSRGLLYELIATGQFPSVKIGRARRIPANELQAWLERLVREQSPRIEPDDTPSSIHVKPFSWGR